MAKRVYYPSFNENPKNASRFRCLLISGVILSCLTGRHYQRTGACDRALDKEVMPAEEVTIAEILKKEGYQNALIGKWHLGRYMKYHPCNQGFDEFFGFWHGGYINRYFDSDELYHQTCPVKTVGYITDVLTDQAIRFVKDNDDNPSQIL